MPPSSAIGPRSEADRARDERAADARLFRRNLAVAGFVFGVSLLVYLAFSLRSFAVPGEADNPSAAGCNTLIKQGAKLVMNFDDILDEYLRLKEIYEKGGQA